MKTFFCLLLIATVAFPHGGKDHKKKIMGSMQDTVTMVGKDTISVNGKAIGIAVKPGKTLELKDPEFILKPSEQMFEHLHNKIVHFPIAIGILAFFFSLLHLRRKSYETTVVILVILGLMFSLVAFFTGINQIEPFVGTGKYWVVDLHRYFGISILITYIIWLFFLLIEKIKKYDWIIGSIIFILIVITGFLGGVIAH